MRFYITVALVSTLFLVSTSAFTFPEALAPRYVGTPTTCEVTCSPAFTMAKKCGYDYVTDYTPTISEVICMCNNKGFLAAYKKCGGCLEATGDITLDEYNAAMSDYTTTCASVHSGVGGLSPVCAGQLITGMVVAGLGLYEL